MVSHFLTVGDVAKRWGTSEKLVRKLIATNELKALRIGHKLIRIPADALAAYEDQERARKNDGAA